MGDLKGLGVWAVNDLLKGLREGRGCWRASIIWGRCVGVCGKGGSVAGVCLCVCVRGGVLFWQYRYVVR